MVKKIMVSIEKKAKSVSPVIAVVLLIALTVAAGAVIYAFVLPLLTPKGTLTLTNSLTSTVNSTNVATYKVVLDASNPGQITQVELINSSATVTRTPNTAIAVTKGSNTVTFYFTGVTAGTYDVLITWTPTGQSSTTYKIPNVSFT